MGAPREKIRDWATRLKSLAAPQPWKEAQEIAAEIMRLVVPYFSTAAVYEITGAVLLEWAARLKSITAPQEAPAEIADWVLERWDAEVMNRPERNIYRRTLDCTWRQIYRHLTGAEMPRPACGDGPIPVHGAPKREECEGCRDFDKAAQAYDELSSGYLARAEKAEARVKELEGRLKFQDAMCYACGANSKEAIRRAEKAEKDLALEKARYRSLEESHRKLDAECDTLRYKLKKIEADRTQQDQPEPCERCREQPGYRPWGTHLDGPDKCVLHACGPRCQAAYTLAEWQVRNEQIRRERDAKPMAGTDTSGTERKGAQ
jgi:hypothetical protein